MTFEDNNIQWNLLYGDKVLLKDDIELMKLYFYTMGQRDATKSLGEKLGLRKVTK